MQKAYNPKTNEYLFLVNDQWVKPEQSAVNPKTGEKAFLVNNQWEIVAPPTPAAPAAQAAPTAPAEPPVSEEEIAAASQPATLNPRLAKIGEKARATAAPMAPAPIAAPIAERPAPYRDRREALDDAVNLLEENQDPEQIKSGFAKIGIPWEEIVAHGRARKSEYFAPQKIEARQFPVTDKVAGTIAELPEAGTLESTAKIFKRAGANLRDISTSLLTSAGVIPPDDAAILIRENARARAAAAPSMNIQEGMEAIGRSKTYGDAAQAMFNHPAATFTMLVDSVLTTLPFIAPALVLGPTGAAVRAAAAFAGSGTSEYATVMTDVLQDKGIDLQNAEKVSRALQDPAILTEIKEKGAKRGLVVGAFDALTMGLAGRFMRPATELIAQGKLAGGAAKKATIAAWSKELAMQAGGGAGGEFAAQKITGEDKPAEVLLEALAEAGLAPLEVRSNLREARNLERAANIGQEIAAPPAAAPVAPAAVTPPERPEAPAPQAAAPAEPPVVAPVEQPPAVAQPPVAPVAEEQIYERPALATPEDVSVTPVTLKPSAPPQETEPAPLEVFKNDAEGTQSRIFQLSDGRYSVTLQDLESNQVLPNARIFPKLADAQQFARKIANLPADVKPEEPVSKTPSAETAKLEPILQNRDRSNPASIAQMRSIAAAPDYGRLGFSRDFSNGSPVIAGGEIPEAQLGAKDVAVASDGRRIPVQYAVVDAESILASNSVDGSVNPEYGNKYITAPRAIAGNGRVAGLQEAYKSNTAEQYKTELADDRLHGVSPDVVANIRNPVLVRVMPTSEITANIGDLSNISGGLELSPVEQAKNDLNRVNLEALEFAENGALTADAVRKFIQAMPLAEQGRLVDNNGQPTKQAYDRLEAAVFAKAYNNDELIRLFAQAQDPEARLVISALAQVAPDMAKLEGAGALDIRDIVVDGARIIINAKARNIKLKDAANQADLDTLPDARIVVQLFAKNPRSNKAAIEALRKAATFAYSDASKPAEDMFGSVEKADRAQVLQKLEGKDEEGGEADVAEAARSRVTAGNVKGRGTQPGAANLFAETEKGRPAKEFELTGETAAETKARLAQQEREREEKERKALADRERDLFALTPPPSPERKTPPSGDLFAQKPAKEETTSEQRKQAEEHAQDVGGEVVWQKGDYALVRGYGENTGNTIYAPTKGDRRATYDVNDTTSALFPTEMLLEMRAERKRLENEAAKKHAESPFIVFDNGIALSPDIPKELAGVVREWKDLLNLGVNIYVSTKEDATKNKNNFTGPHRRIGSGTLNANELGSMRQMEDGSYYIIFTKSTNLSKMLETIAHEMGHVHKRVHYENASASEKIALRDAHAKWLASQKGKTAKDLVLSLRARSIGKTTSVPVGMQASELDSYWRLFGEWYADQTARWAVTAKQPTTIVEKFFRRLGVALRKFYQSLKAQKYLPNETFVQYLEKTLSKPIDLRPSDDSPEAHAMQNGFDFNEGQKITDEIASQNAADAKVLQEADKITEGKKKLPPGRSPELAAAAQMVNAGTMSQKEYDQLVNKYKPIATWTEAKKPATVEQMSNALDSSKRDKIDAPVAAGTKVGLRLDIPSARRGASVVTIHDKTASGKVLSYGSVGKITNVTFGIGNQQKALAIAAGAAKDALQAMQGSWVPITPQEAESQINELINDPSWTQVGIDPERHSYFYDRFTTMPVLAADEVIQIGNQILAKNVTYGKKDNFLFNIEAPSRAEAPLTPEQTRKEQIAAYAGMRRRLATLMNKVAVGGVSIDLQRELAELQKESRAVKADIEVSRVASVSPENFLAKALKEYDQGNISADVLAVVQAAFNKYPMLLQGLRLSVKAPVKKNGIESSSAGTFASLKRIVTLYKSTSGTQLPTTLRHEITHSLEQMMTPEQRAAVISEWVQALGKAIKKHKDTRSQKFFEAIFKYTENPNESNYQKVLDLLPNYDMYQYVNPSEYWAVNAEKLLTSQLGTAWQRFKLMVRRLFEGLKSVLGFDNKYATHRAFAQIMGGDLRRVSHTMLVDLIGARSGSSLQNIKDDEDLKRKYNRPNTPLMKQTSIKNMVLNGVAAAKGVLKVTASQPLSVANFIVTGVDRGITYMRNKNVFYGTGLSLADQARYSGQLKTASNLATASLALDNAIRSATIVPEVIFQGGIGYNPKTKVFQAVKRPQGMAGVYKAEAKLKAKLGDQLGSDIIQGYLEAKRSRSITEEADKREQEAKLLEANLALLKQNPAAKPADIKLLQNEVEEAQRELAAIKIAMQKVRMSEQEIQDFIDRENAHPELKEIMQNWNAINQNMLAFNLQVGLLSQSRYDVLSSIKDYVPWQRVMEDTDTISSKLKTTIRSMTNIGREPKFKKGEPRVVTTFVAEDKQQTFKIQPASKISVEVEGKTVPASQLDIQPNGEVTIKTPIRAGDLVVFTTNREIQNMIDNMTQSVMRMTINGLRQYAATRIVEEYATRNPKNKLLVFSKVNPAEGHYNYKLNGKDVVIEIKDPLIAESLLGMEAMGFRMFAGLSAAANLFRRSITLSGAFQLKQVFKDAPSAAFVSGVKRPNLLLAGVFKGFVGALTTADPAYKVLKANGIGGFQSLARTPEKEIKQRLGVMNRNAWQFTMKALDHWGDASDMAQRLATYNRIMSETGDESLALFRAQNVINFQRHGSGQIAQFLAKTTPFINAWAQSIDTTFQALAGGGLKGQNRATAIARMAYAGAMLSFMTLVYCMMVGDDEEYAELDDMTRLNNYIIPGTKVTLPMNTSVAFFFKAIPELIYNYVVNQGTETAMDARRLRKALKEAAVGAFLGPTPVPSVAKPFIEIGINHDFFTGRSVVPDSLAGLETTEQYTAATSELAKALSNAMSVDKKAPLSPIEVDHLVRGLFGTAGAMAQYSSNLIGQAASTRPELTAKEQPVIGPFLRPEVPRGPEDVYYDFKEVVEQKHKTWKKMMDREDYDAADAYIEKNGDVSAFHKYISKTDDSLAKLNKQIRYYGETKDKDISPAERRQEIEELQRIKNEVLRPVYELRKAAGL